MNIYLSQICLLKLNNKSMYNFFRKFYVFYTVYISIILNYFLTVLLRVQVSNLLKVAKAF